MNKDITPEKLRGLRLVEIFSTLYGGLSRVKLAEKFDVSEANIRTWEKSGNINNEFLGVGPALLMWKNIFRFVEKVGEIYALEAA